MFTEEPFETGTLRLRLAAGPASGPPLLMLHGVSRRWQSFVPLLPALLPRWQVFAPDLRGHGGSDRAAAYRVRDHLDDALALVRRHAAGPAVIYGHSLGALLAAGVAAREPGRVRAVVLEDPPSLATLKNLPETAFYSLFAGMRALAGPGRSVGELARELAEACVAAPGKPGVRLGDLRDATSLRFTARCLLDMDPEALTPLLEGGWLDGLDLPAQYRGVHCPALLLRADDAYGGMLARRDAEEVAGLMAECAVIDFPRVGHQIHWLDPQGCLRYVLGFLESLE
jgi:pimeloyl-ACP methyl ester carboxylesterase